MGPAGPEFTESSSEESVTEEAVGTAAKSKARPPSLTTGTSESETAPNPSGKGGSAAEVVPADGPGKGKGKGKDRSVCQYCWQACSSFPSGRDQHQYYNMHCLTWQRYLRGGDTGTQRGNANDTGQGRRHPSCGGAVIREPAASTAASRTKARPCIEDCRAQGAQGRAS